MYECTKGRTYIHLMWWNSIYFLCHIHLFISFLPSWLRSNVWSIYIQFHFIIRIPSWSMHILSLFTSIYIILPLFVSLPASFTPSNRWNYIRIVLQIHPSLILLDCTISGWNLWSGSLDSFWKITNVHFQVNIKYNECHWMDGIQRKLNKCQKIEIFTYTKNQNKGKNI
jgi:hypothetical protein